MVVRCVHFVRHVRAHTLSCAGSTVLWTARLGSSVHWDPVDSTCGVDLVNTTTRVTINRDAEVISVLLHFTRLFALYRMILTAKIMLTKTRNLPTL